MAKISQILNSTNFKLNNSLFKRDNPRAYLGASSIGDPCWRRLYYTFHFASKRKPDFGKEKRIFDMGHLAESLIVKHLAKIGIRCWADQEEIIGFQGHCKGHIDGRALGFPEYKDEEVLLEMKSAKNSKYNEFFRFGVKRTNIIYFSQMQRYMGKLKLNLAAFVMINKDNSAMYIEFVPFEEDFYKDLLKKEREIIMSEAPPPKNWIKDSKDCSWCKEYDVCHGGAQPQKNCRTCRFCDIEPEGKWSCMKKNEKENLITYEQQIEGCKSWSKGWGL